MPSVRIFLKRVQRIADLLAERDLKKLVTESHYDDARIGGMSSHIMLTAPSPSAAYAGQPVVDRLQQGGLHFR
jgi:hypothetical protein